MIDNYYLFNNLPELDLHGLPRDIARAELINFIDDNLKLKNEIIEIIHGIGNGDLKDEVHNYLKNCNDILEYKLKNDNSGVTIALLNLKNN